MDKDDVSEYAPMPVSTPTESLVNHGGDERWCSARDDRMPDGLRTGHRNLAGLPSSMATRTSPALQVLAKPREVAGMPVERIAILKATRSKA